MLQFPQQIQPADKRTKNFKEVCQGFSKKNALEESRRCPQCSDPVCRQGCLLGVDIPGFIRLMREGDFKKSLEKIEEQNPLAGICGRVCSAPCEDLCVLRKEGDPVAIRALERYAADAGRPGFSFGRRQEVRTGKPVGVVGSGPAGLMAAQVLVRKNFKVTLIESFPFCGGILSCGIPELRMPRTVVEDIISGLVAQGVIVLRNTRFGDTMTAEDLWQQGFEAVLLAVGSGGPAQLDFPGQHYGGVYFAEEFLMKTNESDTGLLLKQADIRRGKKTIVVGQGNKALDCARVSLRLGKAVTMVFPVTEDECDIHPQDLALAKEEGVELVPLTRALKIIADGSQFAQGVQCDRLDYADPSGQGQWQLVPVPESKEVLEADTVILAQGQRPNQAIGRLLPGLKFNPDGTVWVDEQTRMTSIPRVFAAGNIAPGSGHLLDSLASGQTAAGHLSRYLESRSYSHDDQRPEK